MYLMRQRLVVDPWPCSVFFQMFVALSGLYSFNTHYYLCVFIHTTSYTFTHIFIILVFGFFLTLYLFTLHLSILDLLCLNCIHPGCWRRMDTSPKLNSRVSLFWGRTIQSPVDYTHNTGIDPRFVQK